MCACVKVCRRAMCDVRAGMRGVCIRVCVVRVRLRVYELKCASACASIGDQVCGHVHVGCLFSNSSYQSPSVSLSYPLSLSQSFQLFLPLSLFPSSSFILFFFLSLSFSRFLSFVRSWFLKDRCPGACLEGAANRLEDRRALPYAGRSRGRQVGNRPDAKLILARRHSRR